MDGRDERLFRRMWSERTEPYLGFLRFGKALDKLDDLILVLRRNLRERNAMCVALGRCIEE